MTHSERMKLLWQAPDYRAKMLAGSQRGADKNKKMSEFDKEVLRHRLRLHRRRKVQDREAMQR